jgi:hypothetical protein
MKFLKALNANINTGKTIVIGKYSNFFVTETVGKKKSFITLPPGERMLVSLIKFF